MAIKAILFDLDGTLLDTLDDIGAALNEAMKTRGGRIYRREEVRAMVGNGLGMVIRRALGEGYPESEYAAALADLIGYYKEHLHDRTKPYEGIPELVKEVRSRGIKTGIVSNKWDPAVKELGRVFFDGQMDAVTGELPDLPRKPDKALAELVRAQLGADKEECLYVGDSGVDAETAKNAGLRLIAVSRGFRTRAQLESYGVKEIIDRPEELLRYIGEKQ